MVKEVGLTIDGLAVSAPVGTLIVDAAKKVGIKIPTFCYHPKLAPAGMCRMCLVEVGRPMKDRATGQTVLDENGNPKIAMGPKLETSCTTPVSEGMVVITNSRKVQSARQEVLEFLLTSHPLDCPVCDKGGECPLQNLTLKFGPESSRFDLADKHHSHKHVPLGDSIFIDRERCILCGRCVRFVNEIAGDPVLGFYRRGRDSQIVTCSEPGLDSIFSGNITDICPVGALTTADFRFGARSWEMNLSASLCNHCSVNCNIVYNVRREAASGGKNVIKRVMPRQNEQVNEIWICDKGRFGYHYAEKPERLTQPLIRKEGSLQPVEWDEALKMVETTLKFQSTGMLSLAGGCLANEDLFNLWVLTRERAGKAVLYTDMGGGEVVSQLGMSAGSNLGDLGQGDTILTVACDLHQQAPLWWLRIKEAAKRGAKVIVLEGRDTRQASFAAAHVVYLSGNECETLRSLFPNAECQASILKSAADLLKEAGNLVVFYGSDGLDLAGTTAVAQLAGELLHATGHAGKVNSGLIPVWKSGNAQGAWETGYRPSANLKEEIRQAKVVYIAGADPVGDRPELKNVLEQGPFVVVQEMFLTETAKTADVVLPVQAIMERDGTLTSGERRVQRFYQAVSPLEGTLADFSIIAKVAGSTGIQLEGTSARLVFDQLTAENSAFHGLTYLALEDSPEQWPSIGRSNLYYGGNSYDNLWGLGKHLNRVETEGPGMEEGLL